jgi:hypothetical protein
MSSTQVFLKQLADELKDKVNELKSDNDSIKPIEDIEQLKDAYGSLFENYNAYMESLIGRIQAQISSSGTPSSGTPSSGGKRVKNKTRRHHKMKHRK